MADGGQAGHLRQVAAQLESQATPTADRVAVVFGAKGGVGTSAITLAIARDLARANTRGPGVSVLAIEAQAARNDLTLMVGTEETEGLAVTTAAKLGVPAPAGQNAGGEAARRLLRAGRLWTEDNGGWIVIDAGVGETGWARELASRAFRPLLVTTTDHLATVNGYLNLKRLGPVAERVGVIVNHAPTAQEAEDTHRALARSCQRFLSAAPTLAGWLPTLSVDPSEAVIASAAA